MCYCSFTYIRHNYGDLTNKSFNNTTTKNFAKRIKFHKLTISPKSYRKLSLKLTLEHHYGITRISLTLRTFSSPVNRKSQISSEIFAQDRISIANSCAPQHLLKKPIISSHYFFTFFSLYLPLPLVSHTLPSLSLRLVQALLCSSGGGSLTTAAPITRSRADSFTISRGEPLDRLYDCERLSERSLARAVYYTFTISKLPACASELAN